MPTTKKKCICQLCTCGRHMCPHRKKEQLVLGTDQTSAKALSQEDKRKHRKQWEVPNDKQDLSLRNDQLNTTFVLSESTSLATALRVDDKGNSKSSGLRSESKSWSAKQTPKTLPIRRPDNLKSEGSADFTTTHQHDFNEKKSDSYAAGSFEASSGTVQAESWNKKQIPRTQKIKKADTLILSGPLNLETTHQSEYSESILKDKTALGESNLNQTYHRPKTSLKLGGEFQSDSSYQQAFTHKIAEDGIKVQKGVSKGHLKPEGEMTFDTTSLDYNAVSTHVSRASEQGDGSVVLKPKRSRPQSEIKIASGTISDETTLVSDFKRWNVEKPTRHKPADTLQIGDSEEMDSMSTRRNADSSSRFDASKIETSMSDHANWQVSRPVVQRPQNNLKPEGDFHFDTTHDIAYNSHSKRTSVLEPLTERTETESIGLDERFANETVVNESVINNITESRHVAEIRDTEKHMDISQKAMVSTADGAIEHEGQAKITADGGPTKQEIQANIAVDDSATKQEMISDIANQTEQKVYEDNDISQSEEQGHYLTWDEIRPKPIRPHSNLRQEGGMQFDTTNRSEFISRSMERVKGIRPKTSTKLFDGDFDATTMNQVMFSSNQGEKVSPIRPVSNLHVEKGGFNDETTSSREFQPWKVERPAPIVPRSNLEQEGTMDFTTTNNTEFEEKRPEKVSPIRPTTTNKISGGDIELTTTNRVMHSEFPLERVQKIVPQSTLRMNSGVFDSETTNMSQFQEWEIDRPKPIRPVPNLTQEGSMDFTTMNQMQFEEKAIERVTQFRPHTSSKITGDFEGVTTNQVMFAAHPSQRPNMIKPKGNLEVETGKFATDTTNHTEFQQWQQSKPDAVTPRNNLQQEGSRDFTTTNQVQYGEKLIDRVSEIRPKTNTKTIGEFDGTTTNQVAFQDSPREKLKAIRPQNNIQLEKGKFATDTTNHTEFQQWQQSKPDAVTPRNNLQQEGSRDFTTTNQVQYGEKLIDRVPEIRPKTNTKTIGEFDGTTTNQVAFQDSPREKLKAIRPQNNIQLEKGKFATDTTNHTEFQQWQQSKSDSVPPRNNLQQEGLRDFTTTNQVQYGEKLIDRVSEIRPKTNTKTIGEFDGTTTNQVAFQDSSREKLKAIRPQNNIQLEKGKFATDTTNHTEFQQWQQSKSDSVPPRNNLQQEGLRDFTTTNQVQYGAKAIDRVSEIRPKTNSKTMGEFDGTTTNQVAFQDSPREKLKAIRPQNNIQLEKGNFNTETTNNIEFQKWEYSKPSPIKPHSSMRQEGSMDFTTTNDTDFMGKTAEKLSPIKPSTMTKMEGKFEGVTTNQAMFKSNTIERVKGKRPSTNLHVEKGKIENETTASREFQQWEINRPQQVRPTGNLIQEGEMDFTTSNQTDFARKPITKMEAIRPHASSPVSGDFAGTKFEDITTNQAMYKSNTVERVKGKRPTTNLHVEKGKIEDQTTASREFQQWEINRPEQVKPIGNLIQEGEIDFTTSNQTDFARKTITKVEAIRPHASSPLSGDFDGTTTNQVMFQGRTMEKIHDIRPKDNLRVDSGHFNEETTNSKEYGYKKGNKLEAIKPKSSLTQEGQFDFITSNQTQFEEKPINKVSQIRPKTETKTSDEKFDSITTNQAMFQTPAMNTVHEIRPSDNLHVEGGKFQSQTTSSDEFQQWKVQKPTAFQLASSLKQEGSMQFETTNNTEFKERSFDRVQQIRPKTTNKISEGEFESTTTNQMMFQQPSKQERVKPIRHQNNLQVETGKFDKETTNSRDFRQWVKMENKDSKSKKKLKAAGVRTQQDSPASKDTESQQVKGENEQSGYQPWKLNEESSTMQAQSAKVEQQGSDHIEVTNIIKGKSTYQNQQVHTVGSSNLTVTSTNVAQQLNRSSNKNEIESPQRALGITERKQQNTESTMASDYAGKQTTKTRAIIPSGNICNEGEMTFSTTSQSDYVRQTGSRHKQENAHLINNGKAGNMSPSSPNADQLDRSPKRIEIQSPRKTMNTIERKQLKMESTSTMASDYAGKQTTKTRSIIPSGNICNEGEMTFSTTSQSDYVRQTGSRHKQENAHLINNGKAGNMSPSSPNADQLDRSPKRIEIQSPGKTTNTIQRNQLKMESSSTMASDYAGKQTTKTRAIIPSGNISSEGEMTFSTTSKSDYARQTGSRYKLETDNSKSSVARGRTQSNILHQDSNINSLKISGNEVILKSTETQVRGGSKAQNETAQFKSSGASMSLIDSSPQNAATSRVIRRSKPDDNLKIDSVPFDGTSTTKTEYTRIEGRRSSSKKPSESLKQEGKMVFNTTSNDYSLTEAYNAGRVAIKAKSKKDQRGSLGQSGSMDFHTTSNSSYTGNFGSKSKNLRPQSSIKLGGDETSYESMSSTRSNPETTSTRQYQNVTSTSHASYVGHTPTRTKAHRPTTSQRIGEGSFEGQTTSRVSFGAQERVEKSKAIKPANHNILNTENGSTGGTTYRNSFEAVKGHHCPVLDLQAGGSSFTVTEEKNGHIFYAQQVQG